MTAFHDHVDDYLRARRALGFKLAFHGLVLPQFASYLDAAGARTLTVERAVAWAGLPKGPGTDQFVPSPGGGAGLRPVLEDDRPGH